MSSFLYPFSSENVNRDQNANLNTNSEHDDNDHRRQKNIHMYTQFKSSSYRTYKYGITSVLCICVRCLCALVVSR